MEKAIITREQAETIELFLAAGNWTRKTILVSHSKNIHGWDKYHGINGMDFDELATALYAGYEIKPTPEEILLKKYNSIPDARFGIKIALNTLGIEVNGINFNEVEG